MGKKKAPMPGETRRLTDKESRILKVKKNTYMSAESTEFGLILYFSEADMKGNITPLTLTPSERRHLQNKVEHYWEHWDG